MNRLNRKQRRILNELASRGEQTGPELSKLALLPHIGAANVYIQLFNLEQRGLVSSRWQARPEAIADMPRNRLYSITTDGKRRIATGESWWRKLFSRKPRTEFRCYQCDLMTPIEMEIKDGAHSFCSQLCVTRYEKQMIW